MSTHHLDWTYAFTNRLQSTSVETSSFSARLEPLAKRLAGEVDSGILPYLNMPFRAELEKALPPILEEIRPFKHMMLLGIGGSALGARALQKAFFPAQDRPGHQGPWLWIADNIDADTLGAWMNSLDPRETVVVVISKSGGTIETMAQYFLVRRWLQKALGDAWKDHVVLVTDAKAGELRVEANATGLRSLPVPDYLGGRYSVLSAVGLLPAGFLGMDWKALLEGAEAVAAPLLEAGCSAPALARHPAWHLAVWNRELMERGYDELIFFSYIPLWNYFGAWFSQLWAESLGKNVTRKGMAVNVGQTPVKALGVTDQHSQLQLYTEGPYDKIITFLHVGEFRNVAPIPEGCEEYPNVSFLGGKTLNELIDAEYRGTQYALLRSGRLSQTIHLPQVNAHTIGQLIYFLEMATAYMGELLDIDAFNQPGVEESKIASYAVLGNPDEQYKIKQEEMAAAPKSRKKYIL